MKHHLVYNIILCETKLVLGQEIYTGIQIEIRWCVLLNICAKLKKLQMHNHGSSIGKSWGQKRW